MDLGPGPNSYQGGSVDLFKKLLPLILLLGLFHISLQAGTGGAEVSSWWVTVSDGLKGGWGKLIAVVFIGLAFITFRTGAIIGGIFLFLLGISAGSIPDMIDAKYTLLI